MSGCAQCNYTGVEVVEYVNFPDVEIYGEEVRDCPHCENKLITDPCADCGLPINRPIPAAGFPARFCVLCSAARDRASRRQSMANARREGRIVQPTTRQGRIDYWAARKARHG